jgi:YHS domain-containing protein/mono/diheme cytochrome c family protein
MKKRNLIFSGMLALLMTVSLATVLPAEEGGMQGMKGHDMKGMDKGTENVVIDPVCGMKITPETAAGGKVEYKGTTYYFCQDADREAFEKDPEKYVEKIKKEEGEPGEHHEMEMKEHQGEGQEHHHMMSGAHWMAPPEEAAKPNPVEATEDSIAQGKAVFMKRCVICHGEDGKGTGVLAATLDPKPANLASDMMHDHSDGDLFWKISNGKGAMPSWKSTISEKDRWNLVNYIRSLNPVTEEK